MIVVSDTTALTTLIKAELEGLLPQLFERNCAGPGQLFHLEILVITTNYRFARQLHYHSQRGQSVVGLLLCLNSRKILEPHRFGGTFATR